MTTSSESQGSFFFAGDVVGEYQITNKLGEGGMGVVYGAIHPEIGKRVAIKVLAPHAAAYPDLIRRFKEEARAVNKIRHPNIVDIFAFNHLPDGRHYFVMEYLEGESLASLLGRGSIPLHEVRQFLAEICDALRAAHDAGVIHRDLKPDNIWICQPYQAVSRIKVLDFGIAKLNDPIGGNATLAGASMGTPQYMPPEQGLGRAVDQRTDIYALGVILYQMFAGTLPFDGETAQEIVFKHVTEAPLPPSRHRSIEPSGMEEIILECLAKDPSRRPGSVRELCARIEAAFDADGAAASRSGNAAPIGASASTPRTPMPKRTEIMPDTGPALPSQTRDMPSTPTTLRGGTGEMDGMADELGASRDAHRGAPRRRAVGLATAGALLIAGVAVFVVKGPSSSQSSTASQPEGSGAAAAKEIDPPATTAVKPLPPSSGIVSPGNGRPVAPPPVAPVVAERPPAPPSPPLKLALSKKTTAAKKSKKTTSTAAEHGPAVPAKHDCKPNFYFDAQGEKHFKPECF
jgi:serine/threonine protein kinase